MKLINNRYRVKDTIETGDFDEGFLVADLWNNDSYKLLKLYDIERDKNTIRFFTDNFIEISRLKHKNLLQCNSFNLVDSINLKRTNMLIYYTVSEYSDSPLLRDMNITFNLSDTLCLILDLISVIDHLHFRGYIYQYLSPSTIVFLEDKSIKILDLSTVIEYKLNSYYDDLSEYFMAPEVFTNQRNTDFKADYYSLGMMMKYLLLDDYLNENREYKFRADLNLNRSEELFLVNIINNLIEMDPTLRDLNLISLISNIKNNFNLDYKYDLVEERNNIFSRTKIIGREKELNKLLNMDSSLDKGISEYKMALISGNMGDGKSRLLNEISFKLRMRGREVYNIDVKENDNMGISNISSLLKQTTKNTSNEILNKYGQILNKLLPELNDLSNIYDYLFDKDKLMVLNRITNYIKEISEDRTIYIIIDNLHKSKDSFINFLDYLINNTNGNKIFFIFAYEERGILSNNHFNSKLSLWKKTQQIIDIKLDNLSEENIGKLIKSILGISYIPKRFASILHKGSQGNPLYLDYIIKYLYNREELFLHKDGDWELKTDNYDNLPLPSSVNSAIETQLNKIKDEDKLSIIKYISVFYNGISNSVLTKLLGLDKEKFIQSIDFLIEERIIEKNLIDGECIYSLSNNGFKRVMYYRLSEEEKYKLHSESAEVLIELYNVDNIILVLDELIFHLKKINDYSRALNIILRELNKFENQYSNKSILLWEEAYELVKEEKSEEKLIVLDKLIDIYLVTGNIDKIDIYLNEFIKESEVQGNIKYIIKALDYEASNHLRQNEIEKVNILVEELEDFSRKYDNPEGIINSLILKCKIELDSGNFTYVEELLNEALELSQRYSLDKYFGTIYNLLGLAHFLEGNTEEAVSNYKKSMDCFIKNNNMLDATKPINNLGSIYSNIYRDIDKSLYYFKRGLDIANKYGFIQVAIVFLNNLGEIYLESIDKNKALEYFLASKKGATEIDDYKIIFLSNINLGLTYLSFNQYDKVFECYEYLKEASKLNPIYDPEIITLYNRFLGEFYGCFGKLELSTEYFNIASDTCKEFNIREYLKLESRIIYYKYVTEKEIDKIQFFKLLDVYEASSLHHDRLKIILNIVIMALLNDHIDFALELFKKLEKNEKYLKDMNLNSIYRLVKYYFEEEKFEINESIINSMVAKGLDEIILKIKIVCGTKYLKLGNYPKAIYHLLESLDTILKYAESIPDEELRLNFIKIRSGNFIIDNITKAFKLLSNKDFSFNELDSKYQLSSILDHLSDKEFNLIFNDKLENINSIEELLSYFTEDFKSNLDLILRYMAKETLAKRGFVLLYDKDTHNYMPISSIVEGDNGLPNENILIQSNKSDLGLVINKNLRDMNKSKYYEYLQNDLMGIICVPIKTQENEIISNRDRRKRGYSVNQYNKGYIYLETKEALNRFDLKRLKLIKSLNYLINLNIENNNLKLISTVDKLTETLTRKYFEQQFTQVLENYKRSDEIFTLLMLDIDNFKEINDTYGHLKGDEVLSLIGKTIKDTIRATDMVGRYGGEEFILLLFNTDIDAAVKVSNKIRKNIEKLVIPEINRPITVSIGLAQYPNHSQFREELISKADQALYYAKNVLGKNSITTWNMEMDFRFNRMDKLAGILTGNTNIDNRNLLAVLDIVDLCSKKKSFKDKVYTFLGRVIDTVDGECATLLLPCEEDRFKSFGSRVRHSVNWVETPKLNQLTIENVIENKQGEYLIDWDYTENINPLTGVPNWQSIIVIPLIKEEEIKGIVYISVPLEEKEFEFNSFNLMNLLSSIFVSNF